MIKEHQKELCKDIRNLGYKYGTSKVFCDFLECVAIAVSNSVDPLHWEKREKRYCEIMKSYTELEERQKLADMFVTLVNAFEENITSGSGPEDVLGPVFHELELHNEYNGQFFTPQSLSDMMSAATEGNCKKTIEEKGYVSICEPTCGSGVMVLSFAKSMMSAKYNYSQQLVVSATDIDIKCVHMAYLQLSLYGIPAVVTHGNTLTLEEWSRWYTPIYLIDNWLWRQPCGNRNGKYADDEQLKMFFNPLIFGHGGDKNGISEKVENEEVCTTEQEEPPAVIIAENKNGQLKFDF